MAAIGSWHGVQILRKKCCVFVPYLINSLHIMHREATSAY